MKIKIIILFIAACMICFSQSRTLKFEMKYGITSNDYILVNDTNDHRIGKASGEGTVLFNDGTNAKVKVYFVYDYIKGNGNFTEYYDISFSDGSTLTVQAVGQSVGSSDGLTPLFTGNVSITGGNGKYEGIHGEGTMTGNRNEALNDGATVKLSFTINLK